MLTPRKRTLVAFILALVTGVAITTFVWRMESARDQGRFERMVSEFAAAISEQITRDITFLRATRAWIETTSQSNQTESYRALSRADFASYVKKLGITASEGGLQGLGFVPILTARNESEITSALSRDYPGARGIWPAATGELRTTIMLLEPANAHNQAAIGYDMYSEPRRRAAMDKALVSGQPSASPPVVLVQELGESQQPGLLIFLSVRAGPEAGGQPRADAFVYTPIRATELFSAVVASQSDPFELRVTDASESGEVLYTSPGFQADNQETRTRVVIPVADREWHITAYDPQHESFAARRPFTLLTAGMMLILAALAAFGTQASSAAMARAGQLNRLQQSALREKDLHLREMSHRLKNSLTRVAAMARQAARGAESKEDFVRSMNSRLQAMAHAQDMLTRSESGRAPLRVLIDSELAQIASHDGESSAAQRHIDGPEVLLDARETQALGLTLHELATNALKYGAGSLPEGRLTILWSIHHGPGGKRLRLTWQEEGMTICPPGGDCPPMRGFGTQLIDACIRIELGGTIERIVEDSLFRVVIDIPLSGS